MHAGRTFGLPRLAVGWLLFTNAWGASQGSEFPAAAVDEVFSQWNRTDSPGCALAVASQGRAVYAKGYGLASLEHGVPIRPDTVFYSGSISKQVVAFSVALLAEQGRLSLDDEIRRYVPEVPDYGKPITLRQLLHHTSGLRDYLALWQLSGRDILDSMAPKEVLSLLSRQRSLNFDPGEEFSYSNSGYFLLALVVERVAGESLREFARRMIFQPLEMNSSHFHDDGSHVIARKAEGYATAEVAGGWEVRSMRFALVGSGGLYTTVEDLVRWDENSYQNRLGAGLPSLTRTVSQPGRLNSGKDLDYALGLVVGTYRGHPTIRHGGALGGYRGHLLRFPDQHVSVAVLCNLSNVDPGALAERVADVLLSEVLEPKPEKPRKVTGREGKSLQVDRHLLETYAGQFADSRGLILEVKLEEGELVLDWPGLPPLRLLAESEDTFSQNLDEDRLRFVRGDGGEVSTLLVLRGEERLEFQRVPQVSASQLLEFEGDYRCEELAATYRVRPESGTLRLHPGYAPAWSLMPYASDAFVARPGLQVRFERGSETGQVSGLAIRAGRVHDLGCLKQ